MDFMDNHVFNNNCINNLAYSKMKNKIIDTIQTIIIIALIIFGIIILYQIIKKIFGGSWSGETLIISLLVLIGGIVFTNAINITKLNSNHNHLSNQFKCLAKDFKQHSQHK